MDRFTGLDKWIVKSNVLVFLAKSWNVSIHGSSSTFIDDQNGVQIRYTQKINGNLSSKKNYVTLNQKKLLRTKIITSNQKKCFKSWNYSFGITFPMRFSRNIRINPDIFQVNLLIAFRTVTVHFWLIWTVNYSTISINCRNFFNCINFSSFNNIGSLFAYFSHCLHFKRIPFLVLWTFICSK